MKSILDYDNNQARKFLLKEGSYFSFDLPHYFVFQKLLDKISKTIDGKKLSDFYGSITDASTGKTKATYPCNFENVNFHLLNNKDGKFAWRPFQLIHPALYVSLVHIITEKDNWNTILSCFKEFDKDSRIKCFSIPVESDSTLSDKATAVSNWWQSIEQKSIELALEYEYVIHTDITDCYGSIYTHSIVWALHTRKTAKEERDNTKLIGNNIDKLLRDMAFGQTNGIPQGSVLMDFIAEIVLGHIDFELSKRIQELKIDGFQIIRYRDDYRIFTNNPQVAEAVVKQLTEILIELGMRLNASKTIVTKAVIQNSIKPDKLYWLANKKYVKGLQEHLLLIHDLANKFPNSGSLNKALSKFYDRIKGIKELKSNIPVLISILVDIAYKNPRMYPIASAILSKFLSLIKTEVERERLLQLIAKRFETIPNTGHLQIWLQRITLKNGKAPVYSENLCKKVTDPKISIWNSDWLKDDLKNLITNEPIIDTSVIDKIDMVIESKEVQLFESKSSYPYE